MPEKGDREEAVEPWNVREGTLGCGFTAAIMLGRYKDGLDLNAEIIAAKESRDAPRLELTGTRFNGYFPLLQLERYPEAGELLNACRAVFEEEGTSANRGAVYSALADLEGRLRRPRQAISFERTALRHRYASGDSEQCAISHYNLALYIVEADGPSKEALGHRLGAAAIFIQTAAGHLVTTLRGLLHDLADPRHDPSFLPASFEELCAVVERTEGVRFRELFERLPRRFASGDEVLQAVYARIEEMRQQQTEPEEGQPVSP